MTAHPAPRLYALCVAFIAGVIVAERTHPSPAFAVAAGLVAGSALIGAAGRGHRGVTACLAALVLGFTLAGLRVASLDRGALTAGGRERADAVLTGQVLDDPLPLGAGEVRMLVGVTAAEIDGRNHRVRERVLLTVRGGRPLAFGDRIRTDVRLGPLLRPDAPPELRASAARHRRNGVSARAFARAGGITRTGRGTDPLSTVARLGRGAVSKVASRIPPHEGGLLMGMTIGDTSKLDPGLEDAFRTTGLSHLMAVSGANVAMFLGAIAAILKLLGVRRRATLVTLSFALLAFMAITRFEASVIRAGAMAAVGLMGVGLGARREALTALAVAALGLMVWDPFLAFSLGFQLSVVATLGLLIVAPRMTAALRGGSLGAVLGVTLGAQLAVAPLLAMQFRQFSVASLPANVLAVPAVAPATVLGFAAAAAGAIHEPAGVAIATAARPALAWISAVAGTFSRIPNASVGIPGGAIGFVVVVVLTILPLAALRMRRTIRGAPIVLAIALLAATTAWGRALGPTPPGGLVLTAIDVGQGDAWLVRTPGGATMLVDGGPDDHLILAKLRELGVRKIDLLVLSHPHADHVEGLPAVLESIPVARVIEPGLAAEISALGAVRTVARERGIPLEVVRRGARYAFGEAEIDILAPRDPLFTGTDSDLNNNSIVMRIRFGSTCLLMAGEVQEEGQEALLERPDELRCPVMTVPHHGSKRMVPSFFATGARFAVISVGRNDFGHPSGVTLAALAQSRVRVLRTDLSGTIMVGIDARGAVTVREERSVGAAA